MVSSGKIWAVLTGAVMTAGVVLAPTAATGKPPTDSVMVTQPAEPNASAPRYAENFNGPDKTFAAGANPDSDWYFHQATETSTAGIRDGRLYLRGSGYDTLTFTGGHDWRDYALEADFAQETAAGWSGLLYRAVSGTSFQKAHLGLDGHASLNGYDGRWVNDLTGVNRQQVDRALSAGEPIRMRVVAKGSAAVLSVAAYDSKGKLGEFEQLLTITNIPDRHLAGTIGLMTNNGAEVEAWIDNVRVRPLTPTEAASFDIAEIAVPETAIVNPPVIVGAATTAEGRGGKVQGGDRTAPGVQLLEIDDKLNVRTGKVGRFKVGRWLQANRDRVIPAFRVDSESEAVAIAEFLTDAGIVDAFVVSADPALVRRARDLAPNIRGVLEVDSDPNTHTERKAVKRLADDHLANIVLLPEGADGDDVEYFNNRMITVWANGTDAAGVHRAIAAGYNGVVTDPGLATDIYRSIDTPTLSGKPLGIGHRGFTGTDIYPENTLLGFRKVQDAGVKNVEIDLRMSKDGEIVLIHDTTVDRTVPGHTGPIDSFTTAELRAMDVVAGGHSDKVPTLEDAFREFQGEDFVFTLHVNIVTERMNQRLNELLAEYDMYDQVVVFVSYFETENFRPYNVPHVSFALGSASDPLSPTDEEAALRTLIDMTGFINYQPLPYSYPVAADWGFYYKLSARGLLSWLSTKSSEAEHDEFAVTRFGAIASLNNDPRWGSAIDYTVAADDRTLTVGDVVDTDCTVLAVLGEHQQQCELVLLSGNALIEADGAVVAQHTGTSQAALAADVQVERAGQTLEYRVYSEPFTVTVDPAR